MGEQEKGLPRTEWAGMTDWVQAYRKREEVAKDRVGRNDRLSLGSGGEAEQREVKTSTEAARD